MDNDGFDEWYRAHHGRVLASLVLLCGSVDEAAEVTDEAFTRALARWAQVAAMANPVGWTYRVAVHQARRRGRRRAMEARLLRRERPAPPSAGPSGEAWLLVADLPPRQRQVVVLRHVGDLPEAEIGRILGISRGTVASTLHDAHRHLRRRLADPRDPGPTDEGATSGPGPMGEAATTPRQDLDEGAHP